MSVSSYVVEVCLSSISRFFLSALLFIFTQRIKVFILPLERKELTCRLATPPTPAGASKRGEEEEGWKLSVKLMRLMEVRSRVLG